jgi:hypothetical protein
MEGDRDMTQEEIAYKKAKAKYEKEWDTYGLLRGKRLARLADALDRSREAYKESLNPAKKEIHPHENT